MKFIFRKKTKETKTRQKRFFAFMLSVLICCLPTATVLAENINIPGPIPAGFWNEQKGKTINSGDYIYGSGGFGHTLSVTYSSSKGSTKKTKEVEGDGLTPNKGIQIESIDGFDQWKVINCNGDFEFYLQALNDNPEPVQPVQPVVEEEKSEKKHYQQTPTSWELNPNELTAYYYKNGLIDPKGKFGKQEQGVLCKDAFRKARGAFWNEAFSFSMSYDGKHTTDLKDGDLLLYIPNNLLKKNRQFAVMALDTRTNSVIIYPNQSLKPGEFKTKLNFEGYAFSFVYYDT